MSAKDWLRRGYNIDAEIAALMRSRERLWADATRVTAMPSTSDRVQSTSTSRDDVYARLADVDAKISARMAELLSVKREMAEVIARVSDATLRTLLICRYLNCDSWDQIADGLHYGVRQVLRLHGAALTAVEAVLAGAAK